VDLWAFAWRGQLRVETCPGTVVMFVSNHVGAIGPIAALSSLPVRVHPWVIGDMLDPARAAAFLKVDFIEKELHFTGPWSGWLALQLSKITVPLLCSAGCIAVRQAESLIRTYQESIDLLARGRHLLVFPEDPHLALDEESRMAPFQKGFARLGEFYFQRTGECLAFHPLAIHPPSKRVQIGGPIRYNPSTHPRKERARIAGVLETGIREMYISRRWGITRASLCLIDEYVR
jgi:hypothetical protein